MLLEKKVKLYTNNFFEGVNMLLNGDPIMDSS